MSSLVANYSDSESEHSSPEDECGKTTQSASERVDSRKEEGKNINFLTAEFSESEEEDDSPRSVSPPSSSPSSTKPVVQEKMPLPSFQGSVMEGGEIPSVFQNPFQKAEEQRKAILEQHVKMTASLQEKEDEKKKKLPCYKFRKGQCHAGDKCRFYHDKQTVSRQEKNNAEMGGGEQQQQQQPTVYAAAPKLLPPEPAFFQQEFPPDGASQQQQQLPDALVDDREQRQKKKRVGLANNLVPPKRAMTNLSKQRAEERPWTVGT